MGSADVPVVRTAVDDDLMAVAEVYAHHVRVGTGTFETEAPTVAEIARRFGDVRRRGLPFLVAEEQGYVAGFAYAAPFRLRPAYLFTAEDSVYVKADSVGRGIGIALLSELLHQSRQLGIQQMLALVGDSANARSLRLHERLGFERVGLLERVGYKFGRWLDVVILQRDLTEDPGTHVPAGGWTAE